MLMDSNAEGSNVHATPKRIVLGLLVLTLAVRGGVLVSMPGALAEDPDGYRHLAENLLEHGTFGDGQIPTAYRPPLYPLMLSGCVAWGAYARVAIGLLHLGLGLATVWLVFRLGRRWGLGDYTAALAAALVACDPILLAQSALVMTETAAALLAVVALLCLTSAGRRPSAGRAAVAGGSLALAVLCRPASLLWLVVAALALPSCARSRPTRLKVSAAFAAAAMVVLGPWAIRNKLRFDRPIILTTHGGYTLLLANNPSFYDYLHTAPRGSVWDAGEFRQTWAARKPADELPADRMAYDEARRNITCRPGMFCYACLVRAGRLWQLLPHQTEPDEGTLRRVARYAVGLWYLVELPLAAAGFWGAWRRRRPSAWLWGLLLAGCLTAVHTVYWSNMRMRAPLMPVVALAAAAGLARKGKTLPPTSITPGKPGR